MNMFDKVPAAIRSRYLGLSAMGVALIIVALISRLFLSLKTSLFMAVLGLIAIIMSLLMKYCILKGGYTEYDFRVLDYTYLTRLNRSPTGMLLFPEDPDLKGIYHVGTINHNIPAIGNTIRVYVPTSTTVKEYQGREFFERVLGYEVITTNN